MLSALHSSVGVAPTSPHAAAALSRKLPPRANWNEEHARLERKLSNERNASPMKKGAGKIAKVMGECERVTLYSGSKKGPAVENPK
jgi:hypothetical protein